MMTDPMRHACPCCGFFTLTQSPPGTYELCPVRWWEDDGVQLADAGRRGGANAPSLDEARDNYRRFGAAIQTLFR
jgi:hypothetical protein